MNVEKTNLTFQQTLSINSNINTNIRSDNTKNNNTSNIEVQASQFLINNLEFLKSINIKHNFGENLKVGDGDMTGTNNQKEKYKNNQIGFDYSYGILPILQHIYLYETPILNDTFHELLYLYRVRINF